VRATVPVPVPDRRFIGRARERAALAGLLADARAVTLIGPSGIGKTSLARRVAGERGAVGFCDLSNARDPDDVVAATAAVLGLPLARDAGDGRSQLGNALAARGPTLLVLDNAEHAAAALAGLLEGWLERAPEARFLVTSLCRLGLQAETIYELPPLGLEEAVELYEERAGRLGEAIADREAVEELVERLDRLPLAIELAAARARVLRPRQLLARLADRFAVLKDSSKHGRYESLSDAIRCSFELLAPVEATALAECGVFAGGFTLEAAEAVLDLEGLDGPVAPVVDLLEALRDKSLLFLDDGDPPRFRLLESVRAYARRELARTGRLAAAERRHALHFIAVGEGPSDGGLDDGRLRRVGAEASELLAAHRRHLDREPALAARAALALNPVVALRGPPTSEAGLLDHAVAAARRCRDSLLLARTLRARALVRSRHGRVPEALADADEALRLAREAGARLLELHVRTEQGRILAFGGDLGRASEHLTRAIAGLAGLDQPFLEGYARNLLGIVEEARGNLEACASAFEAAQACFRRFGSKRFEAVALMNLGVTRHVQLRLEDARSLVGRSLELFRAIDDRACEADALLNRGCIELTAGDLARAEETLRGSLALERRFGNRRFEALALGRLGIVALERGEWHAARQELQETLAILREVGEGRYHPMFLVFFAAAEALLGLEAEARADFARSREEFGALGDPGNLVTQDVLEGFLSLAAGDAGASRARLETPAIAGARAADAAIARRLLAAALARHEAPVAPVAVAAAPAAPADALRLGPDAAWFAAPGAEPYDLRGRGPARRILRALVEQRLLAPGVGLPLERIFTLGWPGEQALPRAAAARVYVAIRALRTAGLGDRLRRQADGYLLDPELAVARTREGPGGF
jgi:predicted ATPase